MATRLVELGDGSLRQNELAAAIQWHRSRLSHQLSRMEQRGLVERTPMTNGMTVTITQHGRNAVAVARPLHAAAVRRHLIDQIPAALRDQFRELLEVLGTQSQRTAVAEADESATEPA